MNTANTSHIESTSSNVYWNMLKDLSSDVKLELISKLSASLLKKEVDSDSSDWVSMFAGRWEDSRTANEIMDDIRNARTSNKDIIFIAK